MIDTIIGFAVGVWVGGMFGILIVALMAASRD